MVSVVRYNRTARMLHWLIAAMVLANLASGFLHDPLEDLVRLMPLHKALGLTVLVLSLVRLGWRLMWHAPPWPATIGRLTLAVARTIHAAFYVLLIALPVSGWVIASAGKFPLSWFGVFAVPKFAVAKGSLAYNFAHETHELLGWLMLALVLVHVIAAIRHHFILRDGIIRRML